MVERSQVCEQSKGQRSGRISQPVGSGANQRAGNEHLRSPAKILNAGMAVAWLFIARVV